MTRPQDAFATLMSALPRMLLLVAVLGGPLAAAQRVQAGSQTIIEGMPQKSSGAGLVLLVSLQRGKL